MKFQAISLLIFITFIVKVNSFTVLCTFYMNEKFGYTCHVQFIRVTTKCNRYVTSMGGTHVPGKVNDEVVFYNIVDQMVFFFPVGVMNYFRKLKIIQIHTSRLKEVNSEDLKPFPMLTNFWIPCNEVEYLPGDLFIYNPLLEYVAVQENKIMHIDHSTFIVLKNLVWLSVRQNPCYSGETFGNRQALLDLVRNVDAECKNEAFLMKIIQRNQERNLQCNLN